MIKKLLSKFVDRRQHLSDGHYFYTLSVKYKLTNREIAKRENVSRGAVSGKIYRHRQLLGLPAQSSPLGVAYHG